MPLIYITGAPGSGKSTIKRELTASGSNAFDIDDRRFGGPYNKESGELVVIPTVELRTPEWFFAHEWRINKDAIKQLKLKANQKTIFMCGVAESDKEILSLFDKIFYLDIEDDTLCNRLLGRGENDYGQNEFEMQEILKRKRRLDVRYSDMKINKINANVSIQKVIDQIIDQI